MAGDDARPLFFLDLDHDVTEWEPGDGPPLAVFAGLIDTMLAHAPDGSDSVGVGDGEWVMTFATVAIGLVAIGDPDEPQTPRYLEYLDRDQALAVAAEFIDGDLDTLLRRPWDEEPPLGQFDFDRFHIAAALVDAALLDAIGELTTTTRTAVTRKATDLADLLAVDDGPWDEVARRTAMIPPRALELMEPAWSGALDANRTTGRALRPVDFVRRVTDAHLRHDGPVDPGMVARFGGPIVTVSSEATGTRITASAAEILAPHLRDLLSAFEVVADEWRGGMTWGVDVGIFRLRAVDDGFVVQTADLRSSTPLRTASTPAGPRIGVGTPTDDLSIVLAWTEDLVRLGVRSGIDTRIPKLTDNLSCEPGWRTAPVVDVTSFASHDHVEVAIVSDHGGGDSGADWEDVPLHRVLQVRPAVATAAGLAGSARARIEDDAIRYVLGTTVDGDSWELRSRGPVWSMLRTVGWAPVEPTPWNGLPSLD